MYDTPLEKTPTNIPSPYDSTPPTIWNVNGVQVFPSWLYAPIVEKSDPATN